MEEDPLELVIEIEELKYGNNVTALLVYTGDLARIEVREVVNAFMDLHCQNKYQVEAQQKSKQTGSSASSLKSVGSCNSGSTGKQKNSETDYLKAVLTNVFQYCGYRHFAKYFKRQGKSKMSLTFLIRKLQKTFT